MQAFHLDTILSKGIKAMRGLKTINPFLRFPWLNVPFLWISLQLLIFPPNTNWPVTALPWHFLRLFPNSTELSRPPSAVQSTVIEDAAPHCRKLLALVSSVFGHLCWCHLFEICPLSLYCNRLPIITCSWWSCTSGWAPQSEWVDTSADPVLLDRTSARRGRCTVPGHIEVHLRSDWNQGDGSVCCVVVHLIALKTHGGAKRPWGTVDIGFELVDRLTRTSQAVVQL